MDITYRAIEIIEAFKINNDGGTTTQAALALLDKAKTLTRGYASAEAADSLAPVIPLLGKISPTLAITLVPAMVLASAKCDKEMKYQIIESFIDLIKPCTEETRITGASPDSLVKAIEFLMQESKIPVKKRIIEEALPALPVIAAAGFFHTYTAMELALNMLQVTNGDLKSTALVFDKALPIIADHIHEHDQAYTIVEEVARAAGKDANLNRTMVEAFLPTIQKLHSEMGSKYYYLSPLFKAAEKLPDIHRKLNEAVLAILPAVAQEKSSTAMRILDLMAGEEHKYSNEIILSDHFVRISTSADNTWFIPHNRNTLVVRSDYVGSTEGLPAEHQQSSIREYFQTIMEDSIIAADMFAGKRTNLQAAQDFKQKHDLAFSIVAF